MVNREKLIESYVQAGYPLTYILQQESIGWAFVKAGTTPDGTVSDMACTFWCEAPPEAIAKGVRERRQRTIPDAKGYVYFSREREGECWYEVGNTQHQ